MSKPLTETQIMLERIEEATRPGTKVMFRRRILAECADFIRRAATASPASGQTVALEEPSPSKALSTPPQPSAAWRGIEGWVLVPLERLQYCIDAIAHLHEQRARHELERLIEAASHASASSDRLADQS